MLFAYQKAQLSMLRSWMHFTGRWYWKLHVHNIWSWVYIFSYGNIYISEELFWFEDVIEFGVSESGLRWLHLQLKLQILLSEIMICFLNKCSGKPRFIRILLSYKTTKWQHVLPVSKCLSTTWSISPRWQMPISPKLDRQIGLNIISPRTDQEHSNCMIFIFFFYL